MITKYFRFVACLVATVWISVASAGSYEDFFRAVGVDDARTVSGLLGRGFDPNAPDERGQPGLFLALRSESYQVVAALLAHPDIRVDAVNANSETPLMMAALRGNLEWTRRLIERGGAVNREGWTPVHYAASGPEAKVVGLLLDRGADLNARSPNGSTPLMMAARYGSVDAALLLLARGADPRLKNDLGLNAADFARTGARESLAERLERLAR